MQAWVVDLASSPWVYVLLFVFATVDGFFPPIPSEGALIAIATVAVTTGTPEVAIVVVAAATGAFVGDQIAYSIGSRVDVRRLRFMRGRKAQAALDWADHALATRGATLVFAGRYIPIGRVAVNVTAGAVGYPRRRFVGLTIASGITWALYSVLVATLAGELVGNNTVLAVAVGVISGLVLGFVVDVVLRRTLGVAETADEKRRGEDHGPAGSGSSATADAAAGTDATGDG